MQRGLPENIQRFLKVKEGQRDLEGAEGREEKAASSLADARTGLQSGGHATAGNPLLLPAPDKLTRYRQTT